MPVREITDLAVLGIARGHPIGIHRLAAAVQSLVPDLWRPTFSVIEAAIERNLTAGTLRLDHDADQRMVLELTHAGEQAIRSLLLVDPGTLEGPASFAADALQFCFLDAADRETAEIVLNRMKSRIDQRLIDFEVRRQRCPQEGSFTRHWMGMEQRRLEGMSQMLEILKREIPGGIDVAPSVYAPSSNTPAAAQ